MLYVYCPRRSSGAFELVKALDAYRLRRFDGIDFWDKRRRYFLKEDDVVVCWGASVPEMEGIRVLNSLDKPLSMFDVWMKLVNAGVPTLQVSPGRTQLGTTLRPRIQDAVTLVEKTYCVRQENFIKEYRIHSFDKRSIRAGVKVPREGFTICTESAWRPDSNLAHPWVRSYRGGWRVDYEGFKSTPELRKIAHKAVSVLGLTFGAIDIGQRAIDNSLRVLEVDSAPQIEGGTVASYVRAINRWVKGGKDDSGGIRTAADPADPTDDSEV